MKILLQFLVIILGSLLSIIICSSKQLYKVNTRLKWCKLLFLSKKELFREGSPSPFSSLLRSVQWQLDEWEETGRMERAAVPSDNAVSSVTLTTAASVSNMLIMNFWLRKLAKVLFPVLCPAFLAQDFIYLFARCWLQQQERRYNMQISTALCLKHWLIFLG